MWTDQVINPQFIKSLFKDEELSLESVRVNEIKLITGGDLICVINFDLKNYLQNPPAKWIDKEFNTVQVRLSFIASIVTIFHFSGNIQRGSLSIEVENSRFNINYSNSEGEDCMRLSCKWIYVDKIEGYKQEKGS